MSEDGEGFLYPEYDGAKCVDCHLCEKVCPVLNQGRERKPLKVYAAINKDDEIRRQSSSGGIFTLLAEQVIDEGGVVFGARFNEKWKVVHSYTETKGGLAAFRGSKYVQSRMGDNYRKAESFLKSDRKVLFSGTPCQIAGLKLYLRKEYGNLLAVDFICHGIPSPGVWREYLREEVARQCDGKNTVLLSEPLNKNLFLRGFLADLYLRPSCHACPAKCLKSGSDVTIGDFWGIEHVLPEMDDDKGTSVVMVNSGVLQLGNLAGSLALHIVKYSEVERHNPSVSVPVKEPVKRQRFFCHEWEGS